MMSPAPRLSIGLPVYNGERYLAGSIEALLGQSYEDFELIISDNASTDETPGICRQYEKQDSRVRYIRQQRNIGLVPNHNFVARQARGEFFKWASYDDLYAREQLKCCVEALDEHPRAVLAHSWSARIDSAGHATKLFKYPVATASPRAPERFRSLLFDNKGDYTYAVIRTDSLRRTPLHGSYHRAEDCLITELALHGSFYQVEDWLFFRRERADNQMSVRERSVHFDPRRAGRLRNPAVRLYGEYIWGHYSAIGRAPLSPADRRECYLLLVRWLASRAVPAQEPLGDPVALHKQPVLYLMRWLAGLVLPGRDVRLAEQAPAQLADFEIDTLVPGFDRGTADHA